MNIKKTLLSALTVASLSAGTASAAFLDFTVDPGAAGSSKNPFTADKITGNYSEWATFGAGTFNLSLQWTAGQFVKNDGNTAIPAGGPNGSDLGNNYGLYALYQAAGTYVTNGTATTFTFLTGSMSMYLDINLDTVFNDPLATGPGDDGRGLNPWTTSFSGDDKLIATGGDLFVNGNGTIDPSKCSTGGINCGSFGVNNNFQLVSPTGPLFFTAPNPFYNLQFQSGQLNNFQVSGTQNINGSMDVVFGKVPEPASLALIGIGMLGMGLRSRKLSA